MDNVHMMTPCLSPKDLSERWNISAKTVRLLCRSLKLRHLKFGTDYRIPPDAVTEYEQKFMVRKTEEPKQIYQSRRR